MFPLRRPPENNIGRMGQQHPPRGGGGGGSHPFSPPTTALSKSINFMATYGLGTLDGLVAATLSRGHIDHVSHVSHSRPCQSDADSLQKRSLLSPCGGLVDTRVVGHFSLGSMAKNAHSLLRTTSPRDWIFVSHHLYCPRMLDVGHGLTTTLDPSGLFTRDHDDCCHHSLC